MSCVNPTKYIHNPAGGRPIPVANGTICGPDGQTPFKLPCGKCIFCRASQAHDTAARAVNEASMHKKNCFITLTYAPESLQSPKLIPEHRVNFIKRLRAHIQTQLFISLGDGSYTKGKAIWKNMSKDQRKIRLNENRISVLPIGEYGEKTKRPHWHIIIFNWAPDDGVDKYINNNGDQVWSSKTLDQLWPDGLVEYGSVTYASANYVARYSLKKLVHGKDQEHEYHPISRGRSSKYAIGKSWIQKYYKEVFAYGEYLLDGKKMPIPRYYEKWLQKNDINEYVRYVTQIKYPKIAAMAAKEEVQNALRQEANNERWSRGKKSLDKKGYAREQVKLQKQSQVKNRLE